MKTSLKHLLLIILSISASATSFAQCNINAIAVYASIPHQDTLTVNVGSTIDLMSQGTCATVFKENFNNQNLNSNWTSTAANPVFDNPCQCPFIGGQPPNACNNGTPGQAGPDGAFVWIGATNAQERILTTRAFDLSPYISTGGCRIKWWMMYGITPSAGSCEDPDDVNEGVHMQYSVNNGNTWTDFPGSNSNPVGNLSPTPPFNTITPGNGGYWTPVGSLQQQLQSTNYFWNAYQNNVPNNCYTANTKFRWAQLATSSTGYDSWGIDEVSLVCNDINSIVYWTHNNSIIANTFNTQLTPTTSGWYYVTIKDTTAVPAIFATDSVYINLQNQINGPINVCKGQSNIWYNVNLQPNGANYVWILPQGFTGNSALNTIVINVGQNAQSGIILLQIFDNQNNLLTTKTLQVNVSATTPVINGSISGSNPVCGGQNNLIYSINPVSNAVSYSWTLPNGASGLSYSNTISLNFNQNYNSGNLIVKAINACGESQPSSLLIQGTPLPQAAGNISGFSSVCSGDTKPFAVSSIPNAMFYEWRLPDGTTTSTSQNTINMNFSNINNPVTISVKGLNFCGYGDSNSMQITILQKPDSATTIIGLTNLCEGSNNIVYKCSPINNATTYHWWLPYGMNGYSITDSINVNVSQNTYDGAIILKGENICGFGAESQLDIVFKSAPQINIIGQNQTQAFQTEFYSSTYNSKYIYNWTSYNGNIVSGQGTNNVNIQWGNNLSGLLSLSVTDTSNYCSFTKDYPIAIGGSLPAFTNFISGDMIICSGDSLKIYEVINIANATHYIWQLPDGTMDTTTTNSLIINFQQHMQSGYLKVKACNQYGCGPLNNRPINIYPAPVTPSITQLGNSLISSSNNGNLWYSILSENVLNTSNTFTPQDTGSYYVVVTANLTNCPSLPSNIIFYNTTGIKEKNEETELKIYPNPAKNELNIELNNHNKISEYKIYNSTGQLMTTDKFTEKTLVNIQNYAQGMYFIKIAFQDKILYKKIIKE